MDSNTPSRLDLLELDIDLRLGADVWSLTASAADRAVLGRLATAVRYAYGRGYTDGLTEATRGELMRAHGFAVPPRRETSRAE